LSRHGVLVTRGHSIEALARATHFVFDKTGTLTEGRPVLVETLSSGSLSVTEVLALAAALETGSEHAIGRALREAAGGAPTVQLEAVRAQTGQGVEARRSGRELRLGNVSFAGALHGGPLPKSIDDWLASGDSVVALADQEGWLGFFRLSDRPRPSAVGALASLRAQGIALAAYSGDSQESVAKVAIELGIDQAHGGMTPEDKHAAIKRLQSLGATVAMVGDGVNDAPVLAQAHVSVAMGGGTDLARSQGDVVLLSDDLQQLAVGVALARRTLRVIRQNLVWAFAYNLLAIPLAMFGFITPWMAGIGMSASSLLVVLNALRLQQAVETT